MERIGSSVYKDSRSRQGESGAAILGLVLALLAAVTLFAAGKYISGPAKSVRDLKAASTDFLRIKRALASYAAKNANHRLPCPADGTVASTNAAAGTAKASCAAPAVSDVLPWKTLGLEERDATDAWGRRITYVVTPALASGGGIVSSTSTQLTGVINVTGGSSQAAYALVSHGPNGKGGYLTSGQRMTVSADVNELENSDGDVNFVQATYSATFDDLVDYQTVATLCTASGLPDNCTTPGTDLDTADRTIPMTPAQFGLSGSWYNSTTNGTLTMPNGMGSVTSSTGRISVGYNYWLGPYQPNVCPECYLPSWNNYMIPGQMLTFNFSKAYKSLAAVIWMVDGGQTVRFTAKNAGVTVGVLNLNNASNPPCPAGEQKSRPPPGQWTSLRFQDHNDYQFPNRVFSGNVSFDTLVLEVLNYTYTAPPRTETHNYGIVFEGLKVCISDTTCAMQGTSSTAAGYNPWWDPNATATRNCNG
jgi:hypothetical protein